MDTVDKQHRRITPPDRVEGVRCPFPADPTCLSFWKKCISLAKPCVSTAQQISCAAELRLHVLTRSREEVSCQWAQYFHCECKEHGSSEETEISSFKRDKGQKERGKRGDKVLERKKSGFQDRSTGSNPPKTSSEFCSVSTFVRRCNRLRWCLVPTLGFQYYCFKQKPNPNINPWSPAFPFLQSI